MRICIWGGVIKMAVICQQVVFGFTFGADIIAKTLTFHFVPN